jgi:carbamoyl-phosphate synthase small subunit
MEAILALEDGSYYVGQPLGASTERWGELVFTTAMTGYQEVLTDPSFKGQIVIMTHPHIGNYGLNPADVESVRPWVEGFVVADPSPFYSHRQGYWNLHTYLRQWGIPGIAEVDTRALVRKIRSQGAMRAVLSTLPTDPQALVAKARQSPSMLGADWVRAVSPAEPFWAVPAEAPRPQAWILDVPAAGIRPVPMNSTGVPSEPTPSAPLVVVYDYGVKWGILRALLQRSCRVLVVPARTPAEDVLGLRPRGIILSNGPGDPAALPGIVREARRLIGRVPLLGICLGHQVLALAFRGRTYKLLFGHRGANQPVRDEPLRKVLITTQNHGFAVDPDSLPPEVIPTHWHLNDGTLEGFRHRDLPIIAVQFHPEASPGPHDALYLFDEFLRQVRGDSSPGGILQPETSESPGPAP